MSRILIRLVAGLTFIFTVSAFAATPVKTVVWEDLIPRFATALVDPLAGHDLYRRLEIETIIWVRSLDEKERVSDEFKAGVEDAEHYLNDMRQQGLDPEKLVSAYKVWQAQVEERNKQVVKALDGAEIKMAGYLLPLQYTEKGETEFLLVPYIGACIHTPAPPPNQIVFVELSKPYKPEELYAPVWITGTMQTKVSVKALSYVDGSADIPTGYSLQASLIETYEEK